MTDFNISLIKNIRKILINSDENIKRFVMTIHKIVVRQ